MDTINFILTTVSGQISAYIFLFSINIIFILIGFAVIKNPNEMTINFKALVLALLVIAAGLIAPLLLFYSTALTDWFGLVLKAMAIVTLCSFFALAVFLIIYKITGTKKENKNLHTIQ